LNLSLGKFNQKFDNPGPESLVTLLDPRSPAAEAYRNLRTNIQFSSIEKPVRTLLVTSAQPGEDKTGAVANLAVTLAQMGSRVILVDADLRRPSLHTVFDLSNEPGLTNSLLSAGSAVPANGKSSGYPFAEDIPVVQTHVPNLRLLPSGPLPPNPAEILGSNLMRDLIEHLCSEADYVLFDAPPILAVTDAAVLAAKVDGTLLVLKAGKTSRDNAREAKEQLEKVHANLLGTILNNARQSRSRYGY
jgi:capsular exopolysaccharide synthesis family protein